MAAKRTEYQIVGRYMSGKEVVGYHLQSIDTGKSGRYTKEQVCWLVGRDQITNCTGQIYQDKVLLRGKGMSLEDLPVQYDDGDTRNMEQLGKIRRGTSVPNAMEQFMIVGTIKSGRNTVGYVVQNAGCGIKKLKRQQVIELASAGKIGNARVQNYNGNVLLRGVGCNLDELPSENIEGTQNTKNIQNIKNANTIDNKKENKKQVINNTDNFDELVLKGMVTSLNQIPQEYIDNLPKNIDEDTTLFIINNLGKALALDSQIKDIDYVDDKLNRFRLLSDIKNLQITKILDDDVTVLIKFRLIPRGFCERDIRTRSFLDNNLDRQSKLALFLSTKYKKVYLLMGTLGDQLMEIEDINVLKKLETE